jgi:class 3 adenylate cyclase
MTFDEILASVLAQLERERRIAYRTLQRRFALTAEDIEDIKTELIDAKQIATDENGRVLVWVGQTQTQESASDHPPDVERRQLTVMFCDLVGSTPLAERLDPEDLHEVIRAYHKVCATTIGQWEGYIARYVGACRSENPITPSLRQTIRQLSSPSSAAARRLGLAPRRSARQ